MRVRLGNTDIGMGRYLGLWGVVALVFAVQGYLRDDLGGHTWSAIDYLRWSAIQWYTWAALAPLVFRLAASYPLRLPCACANWVCRCWPAWASPRWRC